VTASDHIQNPATDVRVPAEWEPHDACWLAYPHLADEWPGHLDSARAEVIELCRAVGDSERLELLVPSDDVQVELEQALAGTRVRFHALPYGDIWTRDTGPVFAERGGDLVAVCFSFDGWGGKYLFDGDPELGAAIARFAGVKLDRQKFVLEGGAIEVDGRGTAITTRQCLLDATRNPGADQRGVEQLLATALGIERVVWLERGLINDHTDGHVDTLARFVAPGVVACARPADSDPNTEALDAVRSAVDAAGFDVVPVPSPGAITGDDGALLPASYLNFYIANRRVVVPTYGVSADDDAVSAIAAAFPDREVAGLSARSILTGGGAFHCITKQQPRINR
jgi:agmatine deiminase